MTEPAVYTASTNDVLSARSKYTSPAREPEMPSAKEMTATVTELKQKMGTLITETEPFGAATYRLFVM